MKVIKKSVLSILMVVAISTATFMSCTNSDTNVPQEVDSNKGGVRISLGFGDDSDATRTDTPTDGESTARPTTDWDNIKQLMILFVQNDPDDLRGGYPNEVIAARYIDIPESKNTNTHNMVLPTVPIGKYRAYIISNYNEANIFNGKAIWDLGNVVGRSINDLTLSLVNNADANGFTSPAEIFSAYNADVTIKENKENIIPFFTLKREVSIFRTRINKSKNGNDLVDFKHAKASIYIRKVVKDYSLGTKHNFTVTAGDFIKKEQNVFSSVNPTSGYTGTVLKGDDYTLWSDVLMFPGGSGSEGAKKFDLVLCGMAKAGYIPLGEDKPLDKETLIYWNAQVAQSIGANEILEVNCLLEQSGSTTLPDVGTFGNLELDIKIAKWGNIKSINIEM